jgi:C-terminal processing protease CtpA/Prc
MEVWYSLMCSLESGSLNLKMRVCAVVVCLSDRGGGVGDEGVGCWAMKMNSGVVGEGQDGGGDTMVFDV